VAAHRLLLVRLAVVRLDKLAVVARVGAVEEQPGRGRHALREVERAAAAAGGAGGAGGGGARVDVRVPPLQVEQLEALHVGRGHRAGRAGVGWGSVARVAPPLLGEGRSGRYVGHRAKPASCALGYGAPESDP